MEEREQLSTVRHAKFLQRFLHILPSDLANFDTQRVTLVFFAVSGLDLLQQEDILDKERPHLISWLYHCLISPTHNSRDVTDVELSKCGFRGSPALKLAAAGLPSHPYDHGHIAMTYTALCTLLILGDSLEGLDRAALLQGVRALQLSNGSFSAALEGGESDMRFLYCAACISHILNDWSGMDRDRAFSYIMDSFTYEGAIAQGPGLEAHGGSTFCGLAALSLMGMLDRLTESQLSCLVRWLLSRQESGSGFMGRPNKPADTCYSFWVGASLAILGPQYLGLVDTEASRAFTLSTEDSVRGGLAKLVDTVTDPLHTYLGLSGLALQGEEGLRGVHPMLNISNRAKCWLDHLHTVW